MGVPPARSWAVHRSVGRQRGEPNFLRRAVPFGWNEADLLGLVDHGRLPPLERKVEKLLSRNGICRSIGLMFVMHCRFETQAWTTMPLDHGCPLREQADAAGHK